MERRVALGIPKEMAMILALSFSMKRSKNE